jgi:hypothetical protein
VNQQNRSKLHGRASLEARYRTRGYRTAMLALLLPLSSPVVAAVDVAASATTQYESNSNVFDIQSGFPVPGTTDFRRSDTLFTYGAEIDLDYLVDRQKLFAILNTTEFHYDHFTVLDHNEYNVDAGWNWKLGKETDGTLEVVRNRILVAFTDVTDSEFVLQTEQRESAKIGFHFLPDWRVEGSGYYRTVDQSFLAQSNLDLTEYNAQVALKYVGIAGLTSGLTGGYTNGNYTGASAQFNPSYRQTSISLVANYVPTGRSTISGLVGYSDRTSASTLNSISGATGEIDYENRLTGKTTIQAQLSRVINSYIANVSSEIDTIAALNLHWQVTYKFGLVGGYSWTNRELPGQGNDPINSNRTDHFQSASLKADYEPLRWLTIRPYVNIQTRSSNFIGGNFNSTAYGLYFTVQWQNFAKNMQYRGPTMPH